MTAPPFAEAAFRIEIDDLTRPEVHALLSAHLDDMRAVSPPESVHALAVVELAGRDVTFWTIWNAEELVGCGALKHLDSEHGEIKSMRTSPGARGRGIGTRMLRHIVDEARARGYRRLSLETGTQPFFEPARRLYVRHGFVRCPPFAAYELDPNSVFFTKIL